MDHKPCTVIFDFDGTLADSFALALKISNRLAPIFGFRTVADSEVPEYRELPLREIIRRLGIPMPVVPIALARGRSEMQKDISSIQFFEGIPAVLQKLKQRGASLGIVTSNARRTVESCLINNHVAPLFDFVHSATNLFGKHRVLLKVVRKQALRDHQVFYVGDEARDVDASHRCRIPVVAVTWGYQSRSRLLATAPDYVADTPVQLEQFISGHMVASP